jgi:hypothetical protein
MNERFDNRRRPTPGGAARWRRRVERLGSEATATNPTWITASELGSFAFCPQAWYLQRRRVPVTAEAEAHRETGRIAHRQMGRQTDLIRTANGTRWILLPVILGLVVLLALALLRGGG